MTGDRFLCGRFLRLEMRAGQVGHGPLKVEYEVAQVRAASTRAGAAGGGGGHGRRVSDGGGVV